MKVLYIQHTLGYGGATKSLHLTQQALHPYVEISTVVPKVNNKIQKKIINELKYSQDIKKISMPIIYSYYGHTISLFEFNKNKKYYPSKLIKYLNTHNIDILHINSTLYSHILGQVKNNTDCKIVVHIREMLPYGLTHPIDKYIIENYEKYSDAILSISDNELKYFRKSNKVHIVPNPHNFQDSDPYLFKNESKKDKIVIGMCANFVRMKGHLLFIEVAKIVKHNIHSCGNDIEFRIIGYPKNSFKRYIAKLMHIGYKYEFDKAVNDSKINNLTIIPYTFDIYANLSVFDIYVRPDLSGNPWGRDLIEAMALKIPVIATGSSQYYVENGVTGYLVPQNKPEIMAQKILELINDTGKRIKMGEVGYNKVKKICDINDYGNRIYDVYKSL